MWGSKCGVDPTPPQPESTLAERPQADLSSSVAGLVNTLAKGTAELTLPHRLSPRDFALLRLFLEREKWTTTQLAQVLPVKAPRISRVVNKPGETGLMVSETTVRTAGWCFWS